jgi:hypothetical protein
MGSCGVGLCQTADVDLKFYELLHDITIVFSIGAVRESLNILKENSQSVAWFLHVDGCTVGCSGEKILIFPS